MANPAPIRWLDEADPAILVGVAKWMRIAEERLDQYIGDLVAKDRTSGGKSIHGGLC